MTTTRKNPAKAAAPAPAAKKAAPDAKPAKAAAAPSKAGAAKAAKAAKPVKAPRVERAEKADKPRKPKLVRDSFTIPKDEYTVLEALKQRAAKLGRPTKKSEVLRAGVQALAAMSDSAFLASVGQVPTVKTGRPAKT
jgi:hypothetical protein